MVKTTKFFRLPIMKLSRTFFQGTRCSAKGLLKNNFTELGPRFRPDLFDPKSQNHRNSGTISRILRLRIGRRWSVDGMRKCEVIFAHALSAGTKNHVHAERIPIPLTHQ